MGLVPHNGFSNTWFKDCSWSEAGHLTYAVHLFTYGPAFNPKISFSFVPHAHICDEQPSGNKTMILTHIYILRLFLSRVFNPTIASTVLRVAAAKSQNTYLTLRKKADPDPPPAAWSSVVRIRSEIDGIRIRHLQISGSESKLRNCQLHIFFQIY